MKEINKSGLHRKLSHVPRTYGNLIYIKDSTKNDRGKNGCLLKQYQEIGFAFQKKMIQIFYIVLHKE